MGGGIDEGVESSVDGGSEGEEVPEGMLSASSGQAPPPSILSTEERRAGESRLAALSALCVIMSTSLLLEGSTRR